MKKLVTQTGMFGPYHRIEPLSDRYRCDELDLPFIVVGEGVIEDVQPGDFPLPSADSAIIESAAQSVRAERNERLKQSDWTQLDDTPLDNAAKLAWATYRQALRDVPGQSGFPLDIQWPTQPE